MCSAWMNVGTVLLDWLSNSGSFDFHSGDKKHKTKQQQQQQQQQQQ